MVFNTLTVGAAVTPTVIDTWFAHYLHRKPLRGKPTAHISYDAALHLIRQFLNYSAGHTVEEVQGFTAQWVPAPTWVKIEEILIRPSVIEAAAAHIIKQLGPEGITAIGGSTWWQWRRDETPLKAEWVEMKKDHDQRKKRGGKCERCMLYVHGGGYYFGSVDEHRYQIQRHARKLQARVLAPRYRLSPQFPFPCGLLDCLAAYLQLLEQQPPETIVLAGDSAGGGMCLALQIIMRDQGIPLPAGSILISPWVDLTHSFPSVGADNPFDYIPPSGFHHKPSMIWPPPNSDDLKALDGVMVDFEGGKMSARDRKRLITQRVGKKKEDAAGVSIAKSDLSPEAAAAVPGHADNLTIEIDGKTVELKDQIQMYAPNAILAHPLVSPVLQASLGGLPPMQVLVGGGEMLRDEQIYLAHKAANPSAYLPPLTRFVTQSDLDAAIDRFPPTQVQLQVWDDMCHVGPTLSFTRPAKYMFRSIAQFGAWALAGAQKGEIRILHDDSVSDISSSSSAEDVTTKSAKNSNTTPNTTTGSGSGPPANQRQVYEQAVRANTDGAGASAIDPNSSAVSLGQIVGKAGDPLPPFRKNMIRQRVTRHGDIFPLKPAAKLAACNMPRQEIGAIKPNPVRKWLAAHEAMNNRFASAKRKVQVKRLKQMERSGADEMIFVTKFGRGEDDTPPPTALAGRTKKQLPKAPKTKESKALGMWSGWASKHDEEAVAKEESKVKKHQDVNVSINTVRGKGPSAIEDQENKQIDAALAESAQAAAPPGTAAQDKAVSAPPAVAPSHAAEASAVPLAAGAAAVLPEEKTTTGTSAIWTSSTNGNSDAVTQPSTTLPTAVEPSQDPAAQSPLQSTTRTTIDGQTVPFKVRPPAGERHASTMTLSDQSGVLEARNSSHVDETKRGTASKSPIAEEPAPPLQRSQSTKGWASMVLGRAGFGTIKKKREEEEKDGNGKGKAVQSGEVVDQKRPEPTRFVTAPSLQ